MKHTKHIIAASALLICTQGVFADKPMTNDENTIAVWRMEELPVPAESSVTGKKPFDLTVNNGETLKLVKGKFGKSVTGFAPQGPKTNRYLTPPAYVLPNPSEQTFEAWICWPNEKGLPQNSNARQTLWRVAGSRAPLHFFFKRDEDGEGMFTLRLREAKGDKRQEEVSYYFEQPLQAGVWYHVAYTIKQDGPNLQVKLYCSKAKSGKTKPEPTVAVTLKNFKYDQGIFVARLGEEGQTGSDPFQGCIDEVRLSKTVRDTFATLGK